MSRTVPSQGIVVALAAALLLGTLAPPADAAKRKAKAPTPAALVKGLHKAKTKAKRRNAVVKLLGSVGVQVRTAKGRPLVRQGTVVGHSFFLYDFEASILAEAWRSGDRVKVADLAERLDAVGFGPAGKGKALRATALARGIKAGSRYALRRKSRAVRLLRELGRRGKVRNDVRKLRSSSSLDPIQAHLLQIAWAQMVRSEVVRRERSAKGRKRAATTRAVGPGVATPRAASSGGSPTCPAGGARKGLQDLQDRIGSAKRGGQDGLTGWGISKVLDSVKGFALKRALSETANGFLDKYGKVKKLVDIPRDAIHAGILLINLKVEAPEVLEPVHWNHEAGQGNVLEIPVRVVNTGAIDVPEQVACGPLAGMKFPPKGPVKDIPITWATPDLANHGEIVCDAGCHKTGPDGVARLRVRLHDEEPFPAIGAERQKTNTSMALARIAEGIMGTDPERASYWAGLLVGKDGNNLGITRWWVHYHGQPRLLLRMRNRDVLQSRGAFGASNGSGPIVREVTAEMPLRPGLGQGDAALDAAMAGRAWWGEAAIVWRQLRHDQTGKWCAYSNGAGLYDTFLSGHGKPGAMRAYITWDPERKGAGLGLQTNLDIVTRPSYRTRNVVTKTWEQDTCPDGDGEGEVQLPTAMLGAWGGTTAAWQEHCWERCRRTGIDTGRSADPVWRRGPDWGRASGGVVAVSEGHHGYSDGTGDWWSESRYEIVAVPE
ncbi:MAG: hypothetical protein M0P31_13235 [Solirubrobacteraceae bacterium]|nr:hypothetical protein [Solirubrobacteraceae bacterium]